MWVDVQVVLFEGWMLGFEPEDEAAVTAVDPQVSLCLLPLSERILNKVSGCSKLQTAMEDHIQWQSSDWFFFSLAQKTEIKWLGLGELWFVQLVAVNKNLVAYHDAWHKMIDSWVIIQVRDPVWVYTWRQQVQNWISPRFSESCHPALRFGFVWELSEYNSAVGTVPSYPIVLGCWPGGSSNACWW